VKLHNTAVKRLWMMAIDTGSPGCQHLEMPIYTIAEYEVRPSGVEKVKQAIEEFVPYVREHEPGTRMYLAWQQKSEPTRFVHFFIFEDAAAHQAHSQSEAVKQFEAAYRPELAGGDVVFTDYELVASNQE
jgi:quinol monooxygenase YgiN